MNVQQQIRVKNFLAEPFYLDRLKLALSPESQQECFKNHGIFITRKQSDQICKENNIIPKYKTELHRMKEEQPKIFNAMKNNFNI